MYCKKCGKWSESFPLCRDCYLNENYCDICGDHSGDYPLCRTCYYKVKEYAEEHFDSLLKYNEYAEDDEDEYEDYDAGVCITCGSDKEYTEHFFCRECYQKFRNKELILSVINAKEIKILESRYYNKYKCSDGHYVKSKAEQMIDNYLCDNHIEHYYEYEIPIDGDPNNCLHPDFYIPSLNLYIEYWGKDLDPEYKTNMEYKLEIYKKLNITLVSLYESTDSIDIIGALKRKLSHFEKGKTNY